MDKSSGAKLGISTCIVLFVVGAAASENGVCTASAEVCGHLGTQNAIERIFDWWDSVSVMKPLKCRDPLATSEIEEEDINPVTQEFTVEKCKESDSRQTLYGSKGFIEDEEGMLSGSGRLVRKPPGSDVETELKKQELRPDDKKFTFKWMCFERQLQTGLDVISEFIGTLSNNTIHGMAKIVFNTNTTNIGRFHRGVKHGLHRQFGPDGKLTQVVNFQAGKKVGRSWQMKEGHGLMFQVEDPSGSAEDDVTLAIFNKTIVFAGTDLPHLDTMEDLHLAEITHAEPPPSGDGCLMNDVESKRQQKLPFRYSYKHRLNIPLAYSEQNFCKSDYLTPQLRLWTMERSKKVDNVTRLADKSVAFLHGDHLPLYFMRPETAPLQEPENESLKFVSGVRPINARNRTFMVGIQGREFETLISDVNFNDQNQLHGSTVILITKDEEKAPKLSWNPERRLIAMEGKFVNGELQGIANLFFNGNQRITGTFRNGILHGGMISYGLSPVLPGMRPDHVFQFGLRFLGHYKNGHPSGHFWLGSYGGGNYHGTWGPDGTMTGDKMAFIYPDMNTAFLGRFDNYIMKSAKEVEVLDSGCDEYGMMIVTKFSEPSGPEFYYDPPTNESFGAGPPGVMDPFERKWVELTDSKVPGAGQGVFLKQKPLGEMYVSLYSGYLYDREQQLIYAQNCMDNITLTDEQRRHCKKYALGISYNGVQINIPEDHDAVGAYHPTLGPKVNHHFTKNNSVYSEIEHPRWGLIQAVRLYQHKAEMLEPGDELFTYYGYKKDLPFPSDFPWYFEQKLKSDAEVRKLNQAQETENKKEARKTKKKKTKTKSKSKK